MTPTSPVTLSREGFGEVVRTSRKAAGLSLRALATAVGADFTYLSKIEHDRDRPARSLAARIDAETAADGRILAAFDRLPCPRCGASKTVTETPEGLTGLPTRKDMAETLCFLAGHGQKHPNEPSCPVNRHEADRIVRALAARLTAHKEEHGG